jgi:type IV secretory pathway VirB4 component
MSILNEQRVGDLFNVSKDDLSHTLVIGPTRLGMSALRILCTQQQKLAGGTQALIDRGSSAPSASRHIQNNRPYYRKFNKNRF